MKSSSEEAHSTNPSAPEFQQPKLANGVPAFGSNDPLLVKKNPRHRPLKKVDPMPWSTGLFDCFSDVPNCCITWWCPCITFGKIAEIADQGNTSCVTNGAVYAFLELFTGCGCLYSCLYRHDLRHQLDLEEGPCNDCLVHFCCEPCALCQEYRELRSRGFDMSIGWRGNAEEQDGDDQLIAPTAPVMEAEKGPKE